MPYVHSAPRRLCLRFVSNQNSAGSNEGYPEPVRCLKAFFQQDRSENCNEDNAHLVYRSAARGVTQF